MGNPMKIRARSDGESTEVKVLVSHPMETGQRRSEKGEPIAAHFIQRITVTHAGRVVLAAQWGTAVSANPFVSFRFRGGARGETVEVTWQDNRGDSRTDAALIS